MIVCQSIVFGSVLAALMKVCRRWIEEIPTIAIASFTLRTLALTWESHSGWSGWFLRLIREMPWAAIRPRYSGACSQRLMKIVLPTVRARGRSMRASDEMDRAS
jgi:hypothetical protein